MNLNRGLRGDWGSPATAYAVPLPLGGRLSGLRFWVELGDSQKFVAASRCGVLPPPLARSPSLSEGGCRVSAYLFVLIMIYILLYIYVYILFPSGVKSAFLPRSPSPREPHCGGGRLPRPLSKPRDPTNRQKFRP